DAERGVRLGGYKREQRQQRGDRKRHFRYDSSRFAHETLDSARRGGSGGAGRSQRLRVTAAGQRTRRRPARRRRRGGRRRPAQWQVAERGNPQGPTSAEPQGDRKRT